LPHLGAAAIKAAMEEAGVAAEKVEQTIMGCVLPAGQGQAPARQAAIYAGLGEHAESTTVNKMCGSGMQAAIMAHDAIKAGSIDVAVAGGMENMTRAPYLMPSARGGARMGDAKMIDSMMYDGLTDAYEDRELTSVTVKGRKGDTVVTEDEGPKNARPEKIPGLRAVFTKDGTVTAANASSINDGAAALVMMRKSEAESGGHTVLAEIVSHAAYAHAPAYFTTAPVHAMKKALKKAHAMKKALKKADWDAADVDLWEINEAFAVVPMIAMQELGLDHDKVNVNGGGCVLGHPIGASGARIITTLIAAMEKRDVKTGVASLCIGGGEATAVCLKRP